MRRRQMCVAVVAVLVLWTAFEAPASAGVVNPNISVIGQPFARWSDEPGDPTRKRVTLDPGETEFFFDDYLNPYARGTFAVSLAEDGVALEEGYFTLLRGLPAGLSIKGGKYRAGFGKLNPLHPHAYPFVERFRVLATYLPGEESLNETGMQVSKLFALPGDLSLTASVDWLQGDTFRIDRASSGAPNDPLEADAAGGDLQNEKRPAGLGRLATFVPISDRSGLEVGVSGLEGTNNIAAGTRTAVWGADAKAKLWHGDRSYAVLQAEVLSLDREQAAWDEVAAAYTSVRVKPAGGYFYADWNWNTRYNAGASFERFQQPTTERSWDQAFGVFAGLALMEETSVFRVAWNHYQPGRPPGAIKDPKAVNTVTLSVVFSMGPHKAHQF